MCCKSIAVSWILCSAADYEWPSSKRISKECKDLVSRILVADPKHRIAIAEIQVGKCLNYLVVPVWTKPGKAGCLVLGQPCEEAFLFIVPSQGWSQSWTLGQFIV